MRLFRSVTIASLKMYFRNRQAIFWSLFFPLLIMVIFGLLDFDRYNPPRVGVVDLAENEASAALIAGLRSTGENEVVDISTGSGAAMRRELDDGDLHAVVEIPEGFGQPGAASTVRVLYDSNRPQESGVTINVVGEVLDRVFVELAQVPAEYRVENRFRIEPEAVAGQGQGYSGFLVPGVVALSIMQLGIFGVAFTLVRYRAQGVLRRLKATPIDPAHFLAGQVVTRVIIAVLQAALLFGVGALVLDVTIGRNNPAAWLLLLLLSVLGATLFISLGLAVSGVAKNEDTAAPLTNIIAMPMMFLSGVFFPRDAMPEFLAGITQYMPLTYVNEALRAVVNNGAGVASLGPQLLGMGVWAIITFVLAIRMFRWE